MIKLYRADQMHPSSSVVALSSLQKTVRKSREVTDRLIQQLIDTGYIPEEKKPELLSVFDKEMTEYTKLKTKKKKSMKEMEKEEKQREHVDMQDAFDALMGGLLTNVKERQPDPNEEVICRMVSNGAFVSGYIYQEDGIYKVATSPDFHFEDYGGYECDYWFPKPKLNGTND